MVNKITNRVIHKSSVLDYQCDNIDLQAYIARPDVDKLVPAVLICHAWAGRDKFVENIAVKLAMLGYVGIALDVYGKGVLGSNKEQNMALMQPLLDNRVQLQARLKAGLDFSKNLKFVDNNKIIVIGYCFGGLCALDMARADKDHNLSGVISIHGLFNKPNNLNNYKISAKILALHGYLDPMVSSDDLQNFMTELDTAEADWQLMTYGKAKHAFTNPEANDKQLGTVYDQATDERSWQSIVNFLAECF